MVLTPNIKGPCQRNAIFIRNNPLFLSLFKIFYPRPTKHYCSQKERREEGSKSNMKKKNPKTALFGL
jgi:hypothetical protein